MQAGMERLCTLALHQQRTSRINASELEPNPISARGYNSAQSKDEMQAARKGSRLNARTEREGEGDDGGIKRSESVVHDLGPLESPLIIAHGFIRSPAKAQAGMGEMMRLLGWMSIILSKGRNKSGYQ